MTLELYGWLNGGTAALVVIFATIFAITVLIKARKLKGSNLLPTIAYMGLFAGFLWMGPATDFFTILLTGKNLNNSFGLYGILSYMWVGPATITAIYVGANVMIPKHKKPLIIFSILIAVTFEIVLFMFTMTIFEFTMPHPPGSNIIDSNFVRSSIAFYMIALIIAIVFLFDGLGSLIMSRKATGDIKKKFRKLAGGFICFCVVAVCDALLAPGPVLFVVRVFMILSAFLLYYGMKP